ncbi:MAG: hypothetical protein K2Z80_19270 [Xanthobacteraceae bacterium]|nr:hypothetical protein [Xanthobacteraceae bacterium]
MEELTQRFFETLLRTQFLPPDRMQVYQRGLTERLVRHARAQVPFYRDSGRLDVIFTGDGRIDWQRWDEIQVLTRSEAQANAAALYAETMPPDCGGVGSGHTSGSTGKPLAFRVNGLVAAANDATFERGLTWAGMSERLTVAWLRTPRPGEGQYPLGTLYTMRIRGAVREIHHLAVQTPIEQQGEWLGRLRPDVVMGYPGALALLTHHLPRDLDRHRFHLAVCVGEVTTEETRATIETGFRCPTMDVYSGSEFGVVAVEDRSAGRLFISEETMLVEFRAGMATPGRELAEISVTPFYNYAMPLIRYSTGDLVEVDGQPAPDLRTLRRLIRVAGRQRNTFVLPSGRRWWPMISSTRRIAQYL